MKSVRLLAAASFTACLVVGATTAVIAILALVEHGATNGAENIVIVSALTILTTFTAAYALTRRTSVAISMSAVCTLLTVGGGFVLLYAFFSWACGTNPSSC